MDDKEKQIPKEPTKKEKAQQAGKDVAELAAKGAATYFGGPVGGKIADKAVNSKAGQKILNKTGDTLSKNPLTRNVLAKNQKGIETMKPAANMALGAMNNNPTGGTANIADKSATVGKNNSTPPVSQQSQTSSTPDKNKKTNNSGFGISKSGLFSSTSNKSSENNSEMSGSASTDFIKSLKKTGKILKILGPFLPFIFMIIAIILVAVIVMAQIMTTRDNIQQLAQQFTTGIEKLINFSQGDGWMTNEEAFFKTLDDEYNKFSKTTSSGNLDIPLIASTIHYSKTIDLDQYENDVIKDEEGFTDDQFSSSNPFIASNATSNFYYIAKDNLGSTTSLNMGDRRLLGHVVKTKFEWVFTNNISEAAEYNLQFINYVSQVAIDTASNLFEMASLLTFFNEMKVYGVDKEDIFAGLKFDAANRIYEGLEIVNQLFPEGLDPNKEIDEEQIRKKDTSQSGGFMAIKVTREVNYGYEEYRQMRQDLSELKRLLILDKIAYTNDEEALAKAKDNTNAEIQKFYKSYIENESKYLYSYTHYLKEMYIPFTYFYNQTYTSGQIDTIIDEIYAQKDFYNYLIGEQTSNICGPNGSTQAAVFKGLTTQEYINIMGPIAQMDYIKTGILASVTLAQSIEESGWGKSGLTQETNNMFGMKCFSDWPKEKCSNWVTNEEYVVGNISTIRANFKIYDSIEESVADHSKLLTGSSLYKGVTTATTYQEQIRIIKAGGYATSSSYVSNLINIIEQFDLAKWDVKTDISSNTSSCGPVTGGGWTIRSTTPTGSDPAFTRYNSNRGQCVWYVHGRSVEIIQELVNKKKIDQATASLMITRIDNISGNAEAWYRNSADKFKTSNNIRELKAGSIIVWSGGSSMCSPKCGHVAIIEEVTNSSVTFTDGWSSWGNSCPYSWGCVSFRTRTMELEEFFNGAKHNFGSYNGAMNFSGYVYFLEPI